MPNGTQPLPTLTIHLNPNGTITLNAPLKQKLLCMKMLCQAIVAVEEYQEPTIVRAEGMPVIRRNAG